MNAKTKIACACLLAVVLMFCGAAVMQIDTTANFVSAPQVLTVGNTVVTVFATNNSRTGGRVVLRTIQNTGIYPVLYLINSPNVSGANFHGVLAGGTTNHDGLGSIVDLSRVALPVSLVTEGPNATQVSVVELIQ